MKDTDRLKTLHNEQMERLRFLKKEDHSEENTWRIKELVLSTIRIQELLNQHQKVPYLTSFKNRVWDFGCWNNLIKR